MSSSSSSLEKRVPLNTQPLFKTQLDPLTAEDNNVILEAVFVTTPGMTDYQQRLYNDCKMHISGLLRYIDATEDELMCLDRRHKYFVIPSMNLKLVRRIQDHYKKTIIYLPRAVIEARLLFKNRLPTRNLAISMTLHRCKVFLVKAYNIESIRTQIFQMSGLVVRSQSEANLMITDRADNRYCIKAFEEYKDQEIHAVSRKWLDAQYSLSLRQDRGAYFRDAYLDVHEHIIKPFYGLHFKIAVKDSDLAQRIINLIKENQGNIVYGEGECSTHVVCSNLDETPSITNRPSDHSQTSDGKELKYVDYDFLETCVSEGYYISTDRYKEHARKKQKISVKQERLSPDLSMTEENWDPLPLVTNNSLNIHQPMLPPANVSRQSKQQASSALDEFIFRSLYTDQQTVHASTQIRSLPDQELQIEQSYEPSQQLYWNDSRNS